MIIKVSSISKRFGGISINKKLESLAREIIIPSFTRLGMELNDVFFHNKLEACVIWGKQENIFLSNLEEKKRLKILKKIFLKNPPAFLISPSFKHEKLLMKINDEVNDGKSAIIKFTYSTNEIFTIIGSWLAKALAQWTTIHATAMNVFGIGILIIGEPGVGKSELSLELLKMNHLFLCDDAVNIMRLGNTIVAKPNEVSKDFIQIRGLGILNVREMYGSTKLIEETTISVIIELKNITKISELQQNFENLGEKTKHKNYLGVKLAHYILPVSQGRHISEILELAIIDFKIKKQGYNSAKKFNELAKKHLIKKK